MQKIDITRVIIITHKYALSFKPNNLKILKKKKNKLQSVKIISFVILQAIIRLDKYKM